MPSLAPEHEYGVELSERVLDHWRDEDIPVNILKEDERGIWLNHNKLATGSWKRADRWLYPVTWLSSCDQCGRLRTPRNIRWNSWVWRNFGDHVDIRYVCVSCWNKNYALEKKILAIYDLEKLVKQVNKVRLECHRRLQLKP